MKWKTATAPSKTNPNPSRPAQEGEGKTKTPALKAFGRDLTKVAKEGGLDPVIGRESEIERVIQILCRRTKNNPVLIGEAGVGKTAIVEGLAQEIASGNVPEILRDKRVVTLDLALMVAGTKYRGQFEERIKAVMDEIRKVKNIILFIDELHTIVGAGSAEGAMDASNIIKPALSRAEMQCVGATTLNEYRKYIEKDSALERRFQQVKVDEPSVDDAIKILQGLQEKYESHHKAKFTPEAIEAAVKLTSRYLTARFLPDKAIDVLDEAGARARIGTMTRPPAIKELEAEIERINRAKLAAIAEQNFETAAALRDDEKHAKKNLEETLKTWRSASEETIVTVTDDDIMAVVSKWTGVPLRRMEEKETEKLLKMEDELKGRVIGQNEAVIAISKALRRSRADLKDPRRPIGSFLFLGPTGVGKTYLARNLAEFMFGDADALIQIDMSEYMEKFTASRLIGSPPGYVGYEEGGQLSEAVRRRPYSVVLFDEVEKAHPDVMNLLLQILEEGTITDSLGRKIDFRNTIIIMTSNVGAVLHQTPDHPRFRRHDRGPGRPRRHEGKDPRGIETLLQTRVPQPPRRPRGLPHARKSGPQPDRRSRSQQARQAPRRKGSRPHAHRRGPRFPLRQGLRSRLRCAPDAPRRRAFPRRSARRVPAPRRCQTRRFRQRRQEIRRRGTRLRLLPRRSHRKKRTCESFLIPSGNAPHLSQSDFR